jgi:hypothetical protein
MFRRNLAPPSSEYHPDDGGAKFHPKRRLLKEPHGVTSQKTPFFIVAAVKTSNLTCPNVFLWDDKGLRPYFCLFLSLALKARLPSTVSLRSQGERCLYLRSIESLSLCPALTFTHVWENSWISKAGNRCYLAVYQHWSVMHENTSCIGQEVNYISLLIAIRCHVLQPWRMLLNNTRDAVLLHDLDSW